MFSVSTKTCRTCGCSNPVLDYSKDKNCIDGHSNVCRTCRRAQMRAYKARNAERLKTYHCSYRKDNTGQFVAYGVARRTGEKLATPAWANLQDVNKIYAEAKRLEKLDGVKRHVDHIVPIKHKLVCGLHVEHNLQILTASENVKKSNRFEIQ